MTGNSGNVMLEAKPSGSIVEVCVRSGKETVLFIGHNVKELIEMLGVLGIRAIFFVGEGGRKVFLHVRNSARDALMRSGSGGRAFVVFCEETVMAGLSRVWKLIRGIFKEVGLVGKWLVHALFDRMKHLSRYLVNLLDLPRQIIREIAEFGAKTLRDVLFFFTNPQTSVLIFGANTSRLFLDFNIRRFRQKLRETLTLPWLRPKVANIAFIGLDGAGKTTIVNSLTGREDRKVIATVGVNQPRVIKACGIQAKLFDLGGSESFRKAWQDRVARSHGIVFVVDASCATRLLEVRDEFRAYINTSVLQGKPVLIMLNKEDAQNIPAKELIENLKLREEETLGGSQWRLIQCVGAKAHFENRVDPRLMDGIRWLAEEIRPSWKSLHSMVLSASRILDARWKSEHLANKRSVAEKRRLQTKMKWRASKTGSTIVPEEGTNQKQHSKRKAAVAPDVVMCANKLVAGDKRFPCTNPATTRSAATGWRPMCESCSKLVQQDGKHLIVVSSDEKIHGEKKSPKTATSPNILAQSPLSPVVSRLEQVAREEFDDRSKLEAFAAGASVVSGAAMQTSTSLRGKSPLEAVLSASPGLSPGLDHPGSPHVKVLKNPILSPTSGETSMASGLQSPLSGALRTDALLGDAQRKLEKEQRKKERKEKRAKKKLKKMARKYEFHQFSNGEKVEADFQSSGRWYAGKVVWTHPDGSLHVQFDDGDVDEHIPPYNACPVHSAPLTLHSRVEVRYRGKVRFYTGTIQAFSHDTDYYTVLFDDGDCDEQVKRSWIRVLRETPNN